MVSPVLLHRAAADHGIDFAQSFVIGDKKRTWTWDKLSAAERYSTQPKQPKTTPAPPGLSIGYVASHRRLDTQKVKPFFFCIALKIPLKLHFEQPAEALGAGTLDPGEMNQPIPHLPKIYFA